MKRRCSIGRIGRREFLVRGLSAGAGLAVASSLPRRSAGVARAASAAPGEAPMTLRVVERDLVINGRAARAFRIEQPDGTWGFWGQKGQRFNVVLENRTSQPTSVHWHGLIVPNDQDGVPNVTQAPIPPRGQHRYNFPLVQAGTFWMHTHYRLQLQRQLAAPLILRDPAEGKRDGAEVVMFLSDWSFREPKAIWAGLRKNLVAQASQEGAAKGGAPPAGRAPTPMKKMDMASKGPDLSDVDYDAYLTNLRTVSDPEVIRVRPGATVRLRVINGASGTNFFVGLGSLQGDAIAVDGEPIVPVPGSRFDLSMGQRIDLRVTIPPGEAAYPILAQGEGTTKQTGLVLATPRAEVPRLSETAPATAGAVGYDLETRLRAAAPLPARRADRTLAVDLEGDMATYVWKLNGEVWPNVTPLRVRRGERVEVVFTSRSAMAHPMHLHGHVFQVTEFAGTRLSGARRDSLLILPKSSARIQFDADNPGIWMLHCHVLYHELGGMLTTVNYEGVQPRNFGARE